MKFKISISSLLLLMVIAAPFARAEKRSAAKPWPAAKPWAIKIVILTTFEPGEDTGDRPGEFQYWVEREHLTEKIDVPGATRAVRATPDHSVIGMVTGMSLVNAASSVMALGLDPRFDLTHAYFLMNGIAGVDPSAGSIGSAAWARYVVGDVGRYIDPHDAPSDWPYGFFASGASKPGETPAPRKYSGMGDGNVDLYALNPALVEFAYGLTKDLTLGDTPEMKAARAEYTGFPNAMKPPFVFIGDTFASDYFWHGATSTRYAEDWVKMWTGGKGTFAMTEMEDSGILQALTRLDAAHKLDLQRVMVLRTASNYSMPPPGHPALEGFTADGGGHFSGYLPALESAYATGSTVIHALMAGWPKYYAKAPGE